MWGSVEGTVTEGVVAVTVAVNADATVPFGVTEAGEAIQSAKEGAPLRLSVTVPLKPLTGVVGRRLAAVRVAEVEPPLAAPIVVTVCGLRASLCVMVIEPFSGPVVQANPAF